MTLEERLTQIERKLDAALILLVKATTHDDFRYTFTNKSGPWRETMEWAEREATAATVPYMRDRNKRK